MIPALYLVGRKCLGVYCALPLFIGSYHMKQINDILAFADDWMDEIEVQGYSPVSGDDEIQQTKDNISR